MAESLLDGALQKALKRDRILVALAIASITALAWLYLGWLAANMSEPPGMNGAKMQDEMGAMAPTLRPWSPADSILMFLMWAVMMVGMMAPSAAPIILLYARVARQAAQRGQPFAAASWFAMGYFIVWFAFALAATFAQWLMERAALLTPMLESNSKLLGGVILIVAGLYQWTPLKNACLIQCRSPLAFIQRHGGFQAEPLASLRMGAWHGAYCLGCCWALMTLLFAGGIMNLLWIAGIGLFALIERALAHGIWVSRLAGLAAIIAGAWLLGPAP